MFTASKYTTQYLFHFLKSIIPFIMAIVVKNRYFHREHISFTFSLFNFHSQIIYLLKMLDRNLYPIEAIFLLLRSNWGSQLIFNLQ